MGNRNSFDDFMFYVAFILLVGNVIEAGRGSNLSYVFALVLSLYVGYKIVFKEVR